MNSDDPRSASRDRLLIAVGGNAIHPEGIRGTSEEQMQIAAETAEHLLPLLVQDNELVITLTVQSQNNGFSRLVS